MPRGRRSRAPFPLAGLAAALGVHALAPSAQALEPDRAITQYASQVWSTGQGLPHSSINWLGLDAHGYLLVDTFDGPVRFDGVRFQRLEPELSGLRTVLLGSGDGREWLGGDRGVALREGGVLRSIPGLEAVGRVAALLETPDGELLVGGPRGLLRYHPATGSVAVDPQLEGVQVHALLRDGQGKILCGSSRGLFIDSGEGWRLDDRFPEITHLLQARNGALWLGGASGLFVLDTDRVVRQGADEGVPSGRIRGLLEDRHGNVWAATAANGLVRFSAGRVDRAGAGSALPGDALRAILEDGAGNLWVGTVGHGLVRLSDSSFLPLTTADGLANDFVFSLLFDRRGDLWAGTNGGGVTRLPASGAPRTWGSDQGLADTVVQALHETRDGRLLAGTLHGVFEHQGPRFRPARGLSGTSNVRCFYEDESGLWIGSSEGLVWQRGEEVIHYGRDAGIAGTVRSIRPARDGGLWLALASGVVRFHESLGRPWHPEIGGPVRDVYEDERGVVWVASPGLTRVEGDRVARIDVPAADDRAIHAIVPDDSGNFWLPTNDGLVRVARSALDARAEDASWRIRWTRFRKGDGLRSSEFNGAMKPVAARGPDGRLWFATVTGLVAIDPAAEPRSAPVPARIEAALVSGRPVERGARLPPEARRVEFLYTALDLSTPERQRFRYRLEPLEEAWNDAGSERRALYRNLPPGRYRFHVEATSLDGRFRPDPRPFELTLEPWLHERPAVRVAGGLLLLAAVLALPLVRQRDLKAVVARRTTELSAANAELTRVSRTDALTGVLNRRGFLEEAEREQVRARRRRSGSCVLLADLDHFKRINDVHGHARGDTVLGALAAQLRRSLRETDIVGRWGGEEFVVLLPETARGDAFSVAEKLRQAVEAMPLGGDDGSRVTITIGISTLEPEGDLDAALAAADAALYDGKHAGRNRVVLAASSPGGPLPSEA